MFIRDTVIPGKIMAADLSDGLEAETLQGANVAFSISGDGAMINEANIIATNIEASNGVIHVIDAVILPSADESATGESDMAEDDIVDTAAAAGSFETLLALFFDMHNPTTMNRQGPDIGSQYRSVVFFHSAEQEKAALQAIADINQSGRWPQAVVTEVQEAMPFWPAEEYHQRYLEKHGRGFCSI